VLDHEAHIPEPEEKTDLAVESEKGTTNPITLFSVSVYQLYRTNFSGHPTYVASYGKMQISWKKIIFQ